MESMFGKDDVPSKSGIDPCKCWYIIVGDAPNYRIRNFTKGQDLLGEYSSKKKANKMIRFILADNPIFQM